MTQRIITVSTRGPRGVQGTIGDSVTGDAGADGANGTTILSNNTVVDTPTSNTALTNLKGTSPRSQLFVSYPQ